MKKILLILMVAFSIVSCDSNSSSQSKDKTGEKKVGVLLVNHGSHSEEWRDMLLDVQKNTEERILSNPKISKVLTGYMEYTGPSIADQLKEFDKEGYDEVVIVPLFLTVSSHTESDIQNIVGVKKNPDVIASLKEEEIEIYSPKAKVIMTPLLDFPNLLKKNIARRYKALSNGENNDGLVLVAYGST
ncbi:MAG: CbiX/SirB N-terminal domain-containing protein, partial [Flavobacteriales bacterium]|nr:CbiX/SirB N-terminal domain-containing protein [Flavobacteriales bacterium]